MPRVEGETPVGRVRPLDDRERLVDVVDVDVVGHELVGDRRVGVPGRVRAELAVALDDLRQLALRADDVAHLDVVRGKGRGRLEQQRPPLVGRLAALVVRVEEPVAEELELEVAEPVVVEELPHLAQGARLEHVLEIGVPEPEAGEPDARRLLAAVAQVEEAPLAPDVHLDRTGRRPVEADELVGGAHRGQPNAWRPIRATILVTEWHGTKLQPDDRDRRSARWPLTT